jgi:hypothetical protein
MPDTENLLTGTDDTVSPNEDKGTGEQEQQQQEEKQAEQLEDHLSVEQDDDKDEQDKEPDDEKKDDENDEDKDKDDDEESKVPESYDIKLPDGIEMDEAALEAFTPLFKENKLTNEQAQKYVDAYVDLRKNEMKAYADQVEKWKADAKKDAEYGGKALQENLGMANKAMSEVFSEKTIALLDSVGFTSHPEVIRDMWKLGKRMGDDTWVDGQGTKRTDDEANLTAEQKLARRYAKNQ